MNGVPVARILGFEIRLHLSWIFIVAIITVTVGPRLTTFQPGIDQATSWVIGLVGSLGFMLTVIVHELAHAVVARRDGSETRVIVVQFIGSPAAVDVVARTPRAEALVALAGPAVSLAIGLVLIAIAVGLQAAGAPAIGVADALVIIGGLNVLLAGISIIPAFPLDGGRLVRAAAWARSGNQRAGTRAAGVVGKFAGRAALILGLAIIIGGDTLDGIMVGLVGWFLIASARSVERWLVLDELVAGMSVGEAMEQELETISPQLTLDTFAAGVLDGTVTPALPVVQDDLVVGIVGATQLRAVPVRDWPSTRTEDVMVGGPDLPTAFPDERLTVALERLRQSRLDGLPVLDGATLRGVLTRRSIAALLHARAEASGQAP
ncbi:MAG TPA: site-2 protease family protein [Candidatus Limnocylindrales bacterium]|nr:site-2 protease family protein [Candidatus Limnocylindrales bacterium]